jgi:hypothetical protein
MASINDVTAWAALQIAASAGIRMQTHHAPLLPPRRIRRGDASADAYDVVSSLSRDDDDDDDNNHGGSIILTDDSDAVTRGYNNCGKAIVEEIALTGVADVPVAEEWEEATARGSETKSMEVCTDVLMSPRWT